MKTVKDNGNNILKLLPRLRFFSSAIEFFRSGFRERYKKFEFWSVDVPAEEPLAVYSPGVGDWQTEPYGLS